MDKILILDGMQRSALAATRSLGKKNLAVYVADSAPQALAGCSKYCQKYIQLPSPDANPDYYIDQLADTIKKHNITIVLPMTDISVATILRAADKLAYLKMPYPSLSAYEMVTDKTSLFRLAAQLNIPIPRTFFVDQPGQLDAVLNQLSYPVVIKPSLSKLLINNHWVSTHVSYAHSEAELRAAIEQHTYLQDHPYMLQQFIQGQGQGVFTFYNKGQPITFFSHKRLREKPPSGGVSVLSESIPVDGQMKAISEKLLNHAAWHGPAMVEFKVAEDGTPYLIEINGRFWGSLQLAVDAGVDFPYLAFLLAADRTLPEITHYTTGIRSRWLLGDLDRLYLCLRQANSSRSLGRKSRDILEFIKVFEKGTRYEINRFSDFRPFMFELKKYLRDIV